jgi:hypothetical protein
MNEALLQMISETSKYLVLTVTIFALNQLRPSITAKWSRLRKEWGDYFNHNLEIRKQISDIITELRITYHANRCNLFEYSNTETSIKGVPFEYISCTAESTDRKTVPLLQSFQKVPIMAFIEVLIEIKNVIGGCLITNINTATGATLYNMERYGSVITYSFRVSNNLEEGVIVLTYTDELHIISDSDLEKIKSKCWEVNQLLKELKH